jgi:hypothetical protein
LPTPATEIERPPSRSQALAWTWPPASPTVRSQASACSRSRNRAVGKLAPPS